MDTIILIEIIGGILGFILIIFALTLLILWNRRKFKWTRFLTQTGNWEVKHWKELGATFTYDGVEYIYDLTLCTRDNINRPIATYYKGNPKQMVYDYTKFSEKIQIGTKYVEPGAFKVMMLSKIIKDIFADDEMQMYFLYLGIALVICTIITCALVITHKQDLVNVQLSNQTVQMMANLCRTTVLRGVA